MENLPEDDQRRLAMASARFTRRSLLGLPFAAAAGSAWAQQSPAAVANETILAAEGLFAVDGDLRQELREPRSGGIAIRFDRPWEGNTSAYATVFKDQGLYRMYYRGSSAPEYADKALLKPVES